MTRPARWAVALGTAGLVFDGYDLVVYGVLVPLFLRSPGEIGALTPATAGALGSYALAGVLIGALAGGAAADRWGRRPALLAGYAWFAAGMAVTALTSTVATFGAARLLTGVGIGVVIATTGTLVAELAPPGRRQLCTTIAYCGIPVGSVAGTLLALGLLDVLDWRGLFWIGALPLVTLLPLAVLRLPESPAWSAPSGRAPAGSGFRGLFGRATAVPALLLGLVGAAALLLVFALGTWLPELMGRAGFEHRAALVTLVVLNAGAVAGALSASVLAERIGPRRVVAGSFVVGAVALLLAGLGPPAPVLLGLVAVVGLGTTGTTIQLIGLATATFRAPVRGAGVAWCTGFGRVGGIAGPLAVGLLVSGGLGVPVLFALLAALGLLGAVVTLLVPEPRRPARTGETGGLAALPATGPVTARAGRPGPAGRTPSPGTPGHR